MIIKEVLLKWGWVLQNISLDVKRIKNYLQNVKRSVPALVAGTPNRDPIKLRSIFNDIPEQK